MLAAAPLFAASPILGPEVPVSVPTPAASAHVGFGGVAVASRGDLALAVWSESRAGQSDVYGMRIDAAGNVLDPYSIRITSSPADESQPLVVWTGGGFAVVYEAFDSSGRTVWMRTVGADGGVTQPPVSIARGMLEDAAMGFGVLAVAVRANVVNNASAADVHFIESGKKIAQVALANRTDEVRLTATGSGFAAAWRTSAGGQTEVRAARFTPWGAFEERDVLIATSPVPNGWQFDLTAHGDDVVFAVGGSAQTTVIRMARLKSPQLVATLPQRGGVFDVAAAGDGIVLVLNETMWQLSADGKVIATKPLASFDAAVTTLGGRPFGVSTTSFSQPPVSVVGQFLDTPPVLLSRAPASQTTPAIASDGQRLLIAWTEATRVVGVMAALDGRPLGAPFEIFAAQQGAHQLAAIFAGGEYVVLRQERSNAINYFDHLVATHVSRDGVPRGDRVLISNTANTLYSEIALATDGTNVLVAWTAGDASLPQSRYTLLTAAGPGNIYDLGNSQPMVAWNGSMYVAAVPGTLAIVRIAPDGGFVSREYLSGIYGTSVTIASDGNGFLASYVRIGLDQGDLLALALDRDGKPAGAPVLLERKNDGAPPDTDDAIANVWNGRTYDLAWASRGRRINRDAKSSSRFDLGAISTPVLLALGGGDSVIAYARAVPELGGSLRVFTRLLMGPRTRPVRH
jgi:hypothetical protein